MSCINVKNYRPPAVNMKEILRYAGAPEDCGDLIDLLRECLPEVSGRLSYRVCYGEFPVSIDGEWVDLGFTRSNSEDLRRALSRASGVIVFSATVGIEMDRIIARYGRLSPAKGLLFQAIGAERVESLCTRFEKDMRKEYWVSGWKICPRFSPGYGDIPLSMQSDILNTLDAARQIGVTLGESLLMSPTKSVTALMAITQLRGRAPLPLACQMKL